MGLQRQCSGMSDPNLSTSARVANRKGSYLLKTVTPRFTAERNPQTLFMTYAMVTQITQGTSDFNALWLTS